MQETPRIPQLRRRNAIRRKRDISWLTCSESRNKEDKKKQTGQKAVSNPTTPSRVQLNEVNDLSHILQPNNPIVPEAVQLDNKVQQVQRALHYSTITPRRSARIQNKKTSEQKKNTMETRNDQTKKK